jgi:hypothetical protein
LRELFSSHLPFGGDMTRHIINPSRGHEVQGRPPARKVLDARAHFRPGSVYWRNDLLCAYGAIQCVDKRLHLDKFATCALGLVPVKRSGQHLCMPIPVLDHTRAGFVQSFKSLAHLGSFASISNLAANISANAAEI